MTNTELCEKIRTILKEGYFGDAQDLVDVSSGPDDDVHIVIVSRKFDGKRMEEKSDLIWSELIGKLSESEWRLVSLSIGASPEEVKSL